MKIIDVVIKASAFWVMIGSLLITLGASGVNIPEWAPKLFSQGFVDALLIALGSVIDFVQFVRTIFAAKDSGGEVQTLSASKAAVYYLNPFKVAA